jgi:hypothetical protein
MAEAAGVKSDYDAAHGWASTFGHGNWSALRDACMTHCVNPLHRLHRAPIPGHRILEDVVPDAFRLVNKILEDLSTLFPPWSDRLTLPAAAAVAHD